MKKIFVTVSSEGSGSVGGGVGGGTIVGGNVGGGDGRFVGSTEGT